LLSYGLTNRVITVHIDFLDFEQPIAELESEIMALRHQSDTMEKPDVTVNLQRIKRLQAKSNQLTKKIYRQLKPFEVVKVARHPMRPYSTDYIPRMFTEFQELHGDRNYGDDAALVCGVGRFRGEPVVVIGQEKGRSTSDKIQRNFGMAKPEGYRKALRIMNMAERFKLPVISLIDTPGAYPNIEAEERCISGAIAENLARMSSLKTPIICAVIGEGSSGGALGVGVGDCVIMMQYATYFVISPEGCANIIWKTSAKAPEAAAAMGITSDALSKLGIIDNVVNEPLGGAHRDYDIAANNLADSIATELGALQAMSMRELLDRRYQRLLKYGNPPTEH
jgi:acetyl-CoA carboxylase carboxyl transferase subunit alpha